MEVTLAHRGAMSTRQEQPPATSTEALDEHQAAADLGVEVKTVRKWRLEGRGPRWMKYGPGRAAAVRYRRSDLEEFKRSSVVEPGQPA